MQRKIYVSGCYSGPSPSAGLGLARSLRAAFPDAILVGVDYWSGSSGLSHEVFDEVWLQPSWEHIDHDLHAERIRQLLSSGAYWLSALDVEVRWLATRIGAHPRLLSPGPEAVAATAKVGGRVARLLPFPEPEAITTAKDDLTLHAFCRRHSWRVWLKGPYHDALPVTSWRGFEAARQALAARWNAETLLVQAHVRGHEESICIAAWQGELLAAVHMEKRLTTPDGKTWAGRVKTVPPMVYAAVATAVKELGWSGGAEIEMILDADGRRWFMEWNPRFPAWVHGATLAGKNLVAHVLAAAAGLPVPGCTVESDEFTRVVTEIPVRKTLSLPPRVEHTSHQLVVTGKYGAALGTLARALDGAQEGLDGADARGEGTPSAALAAVDPLILRDLACQKLDLPSPARLFLAETAQTAFATIAARTAETCVQPAYSFKTAPDDRYFALAREHGFLAECISLLEVDRALKAGFAPGEIVLNGPGKWWPQTLTPPDGLRAVFADSLEELTRLVARPALARTIGVRLRLPSLVSRFGIGLDDPDTLAAVAAQLRRLPPDVGLGVHWHVASSGLGVSRWHDGFEAVLAWAEALAAATGRPITTLDIGGGWSPEDFARLDFNDLERRARRALPELTTILAEPGKAVTQPTMALTTRVLDVRRGEGGAIDELVVDASIADLPLATFYPHRILRLERSGAVRVLPRGRTRLLGRICMEDDCLATGLDVPFDTKVGDLFLVLDAGAYERSMSYDFGRG